MSPPDGVLGWYCYFKTEKIKNKLVLFWIRHWPDVYHPRRTKKMSFIYISLYDGFLLNFKTRACRLSVFCFCLTKPRLSNSCGPKNEGVRFWHGWFAAMLRLVMATRSLLSVMFGFCRRKDIISPKNILEDSSSNWCKYRQSFRRTDKKWFSFQECLPPKVLHWEAVL